MTGSSGSRATGVLVLGARGQVGRALLATAGQRPVVGLGRQEADLTERSSVRRALDRHRPATVINAAVFQPVDLCEEHPRRAFEVNAVAAGAVAEECAARGLRLTQLSTDYVFDGRRREPYPEDARPRPLSVYAASKLAGEHLVLAASPAHRVVRTSSVYGIPTADEGTPSFVARMLERARAGRTTRVVDDQVVSPTAAEDLARALWELEETDEAGIFHCAGVEEASWYRIAERVFEHAGRPDLLSATTAEEYGAAARRPAYSALDNRRLRALGIGEPTGWRTGVDRFLEAVGRGD